MRKAISFGFLVIALSFALSLWRPSAHSAPQESPARTKWEYRVLTKTGYEESKLEAKLNQLGDQGWELVAIETAFAEPDPRPDGQVIIPPVYYLKRSKLLPK
jgi:hypothetical protein